MPPKKECLTEEEEQMFADKYNINFNDIPKRHHLTNLVRQLKEEPSVAEKIIRSLHKHNKTIRTDYLFKVWRQAFQPNNNASVLASDVPLPADDDDDDLFDLNTLHARQVQKLKSLEASITAKTMRKKVLEEELAQLNLSLTAEESKYEQFVIAFNQMYPPAATNPTTPTTVDTDETTTA